MIGLSAHVVSVYHCRVCESYYAAKMPGEMADLIIMHLLLFHGGRRDTPGQVTHWTVYEAEVIEDDATSSHL